MLTVYQLPRLYQSLGEKSIEKLGIDLLPFLSATAVFFVLLYFAGLYLFLKDKISLDSLCRRSKKFFSAFSDEKIIFASLLSFIMLDLLLSQHIFSSVHVIRFSFFLLPIFYLLLSRILLKMKRNRLAVALFILFVASASFELYRYYTIDSKEQFQEAAEYIEARASPADVLFLHRATIAKLCFDYYYSGDVEEVRLIDPGKDDRLLIERAAGKRDAYLVLSHNYHTKDYFKQKFDSLYGFTEEKKFIGVTIYKYEVSES